jgi:hypothetical protein
MPKRKLHQCRCANCLQEQTHPDQELHRQMNQFLSRLDEQQRRWYVALESKKLGHGGDMMLSRITGMHRETIRPGRQELNASLSWRPMGRVRLPGAGRPSLKKKIHNSERT